MTVDRETIKNDIIAALSHPEAEEGLYLDNLHVLHEEEERPIVRGTQFEILESLKEMISLGLVKTDESGDNVVFHLVQK